MTGPRAVCCCINPALAESAKWFIKAVPPVYLQHPIVAAAAIGYLERKLEGEFCNEAIVVLLGEPTSAFVEGSVNCVSAVASALA